MRKNWTLLDLSLKYSSNVETVPSDMIHPVKLPHHLTENHSAIYTAKVKLKKTSSRKVDRMELRKKKIGKMENKCRQPFIPLVPS